MRAVVEANFMRIDAMMACLAAAMTRKKTTNSKRHKENWLCFFQLDLCRSIFFLAFSYTHQFALIEIDYVFQTGEFRYRCDMTFYSRQNFDDFWRSLIFAQVS